MKYFFLIIFALITTLNCFAQVDTVPVAETTHISLPKLPVVKKIITQRKNADSIGNRVIEEGQPKELPESADIVSSDSSKQIDSVRKDSVQVLVRVSVKDTGTYRKFETHPFLPFQAIPIYMLVTYHQPESKDELFYLMAAIMFGLAFIRAAFPKYFRNLFVVFFQTTLRQTQSREQLLQDNLASLLINLLYIICTGLYITLLIQYKHWSQAPFWSLAFGSAGILSLVYLGKYLFLIFAGWVFNTKEAAGAYTFIVFMVNKVIGVALIPFLLVLSFSGPTVIEISVTVSLALIGVLFVYRYLVSFLALQNKLKVNALHFFLYLCAVEVLPLVLIYKLLINYMAGSF